MRRNDASRCWLKIPLLWRGGRRSLTGWFMRNTQHYMSLPFNPKLKQRAKELRKAGLLHEALLWNQLKRKQFNGLDFDRQKIIGNYIVDFFCAEKQVVIEADGASHQGREDYDSERDAYLNGLGLTVIRLAVRDILQDMEAVLAFLRNHRALMGTHPEQGNIPAVDCPRKKGWQAKPNEVVKQESNPQQTRKESHA